MKESAQDQDFHVLVAGYLPPPVGGVRIACKILLDFLQAEPGVELTFVQLTGGRRGWLARVAGLARALATVLIRYPRVDLVLLQPTNRALLMLGPPLYMASRLLGKPLMVRKFAGDFRAVFSSYPQPLRFLLRKTVLQCDLFLFETRALCDYFSTICRRVEFFPNNRPPGKCSPGSKRRARRFVFLGQMKKDKGVEKLFRIGRNLPAKITIDLFGPTGYDISPQDLRMLGKNSRTRYRGSVAPADVAATLENYDVLLLPSARHSEGYPGVILEAFQCGLPAIASRCGGIPELLDDSCGRLVEPDDQEELQRAILEMFDSPEIFRRLRAGAKQRSRRYDSDIWNRRFLDYCRRLVLPETSR